MKAKEMISLLKSHGWNHVRTTGSHYIMKHGQSGELISVPYHGNKDLKPGTLNAILKKAEIKT